MKAKMRILNVCYEWFGSWNETRGTFRPDSLDIYGCQYRDIFQTLFVCLFVCNAVREKFCRNQKKKKNYLLFIYLADRRGQGVSVQWKRSIETGWIECEVCFKQ